jgi:hypothetical protein
MNHAASRSLFGGVCLLLLASFAAPLVGGCSSVRKRDYEVNVTNESSKPVTVWLAKNGMPYEPGWKAPEDLAIEFPGKDEPIAGVVVPAGKTASTGKVTGQFAPGVDAILRVYLGQKKFAELLAVNRDSPDRIDIALKPGINDVLVTDRGAGIGATLSSR